MSTRFNGRGVRSLGLAAALGLIALAGAGCSTEEQAAVGTIEMGKGDKNNLMNFGGGDAVASPGPGEGPRRGPSKMINLGPDKSVKRGGRGGAAR